MRARARTGDRARRLLMVAALAASACGESIEHAPPGAPTTSSTTEPPPAPPPPILSGPPLLFAPTASGFGLSALMTGGDPSILRLHVRRAGDSAWSALAAPAVPAPDLAQWSVTGLNAGTLYEYEIGAAAGDVLGVSYRGSVTTARPPGSSFTFALVTDTHIGSNLAYSNQGDETVLSRTGLEIATAQPDFIVNLGDILDFHEYGFVNPPPASSVTRDAYVNYRESFGDVLGHASHFPVIGGWDSENGCNTLEEIERSRSQRLLYLPGPDPETYPGGSPFEDYYAFTWGDALFVVLNVFTYTPTCHRLDWDPGLADDWTLGDAQLEFLRQTLEHATSRWRFLFIHHPVGGAAGTDVESAYGRGGGRAAHVGEQDIVHALMQTYGVQIFFYGHDHVFTDMTVDATHYTLPGSAGSIWPFTDAQTGYTKSWPDSGWGRIDVSADSVHVAFMSLGNVLLYEYTLQ